MPQGVPSLALQKAWLHFEICAFEATFAELQNVLSRSKFDQFALAKTRPAFVDGLLLHLRLVSVTQVVKDFSDLKVNKFLARALTLSA